MSRRNNPELYGILLYHLLLLCTLLAAALIEIDHNRPPLRLFVPALAIGVIAPLIWPYLRPTPAWPGLADWISRVLDCVAGLAAGGFLGYIAWRMQQSKGTVPFSLTMPTTADQHFVSVPARCPMVPRNGQSRRHGMGTAVRGSFSGLAGRLRRGISDFAIGLAGRGAWQTPKKGRAFAVFALAIYCYVGVDIGMVANCGFRKTDCVLELLTLRRKYRN